MEVSGHDVAATLDCKVFGCPEDADARRGRYAGLCSRHKRERIELDRHVVREAEPDPEPTDELERALFDAAGIDPDDRTVDSERVVRSNGDGSSLADTVKKLLPASKKLEVAVRAKRDASGTARAAVEEFQALLREVRDAAQALIDGT